MSLHSLRETLVKFKNDSTASRGRIKRLQSQIEELDGSIATQTKVNDGVAAEVDKLKVIRQTLLEQIDGKTKKLEEKSSFIADKVVKPADDGIGAAKRAIEAFEEMKGVGVKLQLLLSQVNPGMEDKDTNTEVRPVTHSSKNGGDDVRADLLATEERLLALTKEYQEAKDVSKGSRPKGNTLFEPISYSEWERKLDSIAKVRQRQVRLLAELDQIEEEKLRPMVTKLQPVAVEPNDLDAGGDILANAIFSAMDTTEQDNMHDLDVPSAGRVVVRPVEDLPVQPEDMGADYTSSFVSAASIDDEDDETPYVSVYATSESYTSKDYYGTDQ